MPTSRQDMTPPNEHLQTENLYTLQPDIAGEKTNGVAGPSNHYYEGPTT